MRNFPGAKVVGFTRHESDQFDSFEKQLGLGNAAFYQEALKCGSSALLALSIDFEKWIQDSDVADRKIAFSLFRSSHEREMRHWAEMIVDVMGRTQTPASAVIPRLGGSARVVARYLAKTFFAKQIFF